MHARTHAREQAGQWVECVVDLSVRKFAGVKPLGKRLKMGLEKFILPNACKARPMPSATPPLAPLLRVPFLLFTCLQPPAQP